MRIGARLDVGRDWQETSRSEQGIMKMTRYEWLAVAWFIAAGTLLFDSIA